VCGLADALQQDTIRASIAVGELLRCADCAEFWQGTKSVACW
jgi:hypothetical protein